MNSYWRCERGELLVALLPRLPKSALYLLRLIFATALLCWSVGSLFAQSHTLPAARVLIVPGDYVRVTVWRKPELTGDFLVAADSSLKHPLYQDVKVGGLPVGAAQERLRTYLLKYETAPQLSLEPLFQVAVGGEVRSPNLFKLSPETNIPQAVALAGGVNDRGRLSQVRLLRGGQDILLDLTQPAGPAVETFVESGDRIFVGRRRDFFHDDLAPIASVASVLLSISLLFTRR